MMRWVQALCKQDVCRLTEGPSCPSGNEYVGWVESFAKPIMLQTGIDGFREEINPSYATSANAPRLLSEHAFRILLQSSGNVPPDVRFYLRKLEDTGMKKLGIALAALGALVLAAPSTASAETIIIKKRGGYHGHHHHYHGARAEYRPHRHWHRGHDRVVVIKKHRY